MLCHGCDFGCYINNYSFFAKCGIVLFVESAMFSIKH